MALSTQAKWAVGIGAAVFAGLIALAVRRGKNKRKADKVGEESAALAVKNAEAQGVPVPQGADAIIREGVSLLNQKKIDEWQFQALLVQLRALHFPVKAIDGMMDFLAWNQRKVYDDWIRHSKYPAGNKSKTTWDNNVNAARLLLGLMAQKRAAAEKSAAAAAAIAGKYKDGPAPKPDAN